MSKYRLVEASLDDKWDRFIESSPNGTAFASRAYLESLGIPVHAYYCLKNQEPVAALILPVNDTGERVIEHEFLIYYGLIYRHLPLQNRSQTNSEQFQIQEAVAHILIERYRSIHITLHPSIVDIRPFLWVNYGTDLPKYTVGIRYTSYVDISDFPSSTRLEDIAIYNQASTARRQEIRYGIRKGVTTEETDDVEMFVDYYRKTMGRQGIEVLPALREQMLRLLVGLIASKKLVLMASKDAAGRVGSMAAYLLDTKRAYYLFGANDPEMRDTHTGTAVLWQAFYILADRGVKEVDLEGVNSPHRGWFKLSFGGDIRPYYELKYEISHLV